MTQAILDLSHYAWKRDLNGLTLIGTWIYRERRHRPCMVLIRSGEEMSDHTMPCVVTVDKAWIWSEEIGDAAQAAQTAFAFASALRLDDTPETIYRLAALINDHLSDLLTIPPYSSPNSTLPSGAHVIGHMSITDRQTGTTRDMELTDPDV